MVTSMKHSRALREFQEGQVSQARRVKWACRAYQDLMGKRVLVVKQETLDSLAHQDHLDLKDPRGRQELWDSPVLKETKEISDWLDHLV